MDAFASRMIFRGMSSTVLAALMATSRAPSPRKRYIHLLNAVQSDEATRVAMSMHARHVCVAAFVEADGLELERLVRHRYASV